MGGSKKTTQTQTQTSSAPEYLQPYYLQAGQDAQSVYNNAAVSYPTQTVAGMSDDSQAALDMIRNRATQGSAVQAAGNQNYLDTISGKFLSADSNPYLQSYMDAVNRSTTNQYNTSVAPSISSAYAKAGRYGSNSYNTTIANSQQALAQQLADSNAAIGFNNYNNERARQFNAATNAPAMALADYQDANALNQAGLQQQQQDQAMLDAEFEKWQFLNGGALDDYIQRIQALRGNDGTVTGTTTSKQKGNALSTALGLAATGAGYYFGGPAGGAAAGKATGTI